MPTLYLSQQGAVLRKTSQRLVVEKENKRLLEVPAFQVDRILIFGNIQISSQTITFLLERGIDVSFLSMGGKLRGRLASAESKNAFLRLAQYDRSRDEAFRLRLAKSLIDGKLKNQKALLYRFQRNHPEVDFCEPIAVIDRALGQLPHKKQLDSVLGVEGGATGAYFRTFGQMLRKSFEFQGRQRRPPRDPVNALLSFGYVLITNELGGVLESLGFDPFIGFLHGIRYGRRSLALDLVEEFRHPLADTMTLSLVNLGVLKEEDFQATAEDGVRMTPEGLRKYFEHYEKRLNKPFTDEAGDSKVGFRQLFRSQAERLEHAILEDQEYQPFVYQ
jgi:CRISPR-associated protein Cas1